MFYAHFMKVTDRKELLAMMSFDLCFGQQEVFKKPRATTFRRMYYFKTNQSAILLEANGRMSPGKRLHHLVMKRSCAHLRL